MDKPGFFEIVEMTTNAATVLQLRARIRIIFLPNRPCSDLPVFTKPPFLNGFDESPAISANAPDPLLHCNRRYSPYVKDSEDNGRVYAIGSAQVAPHSK